MKRLLGDFDARFEPFAILGAVGRVKDHPAVKTPDVESLPEPSLTEFDALLLDCEVAGYIPPSVADRVRTIRDDAIRVQTGVLAVHTFARGLNR